MKHRAKQRAIALSFAAVAVATLAWLFLQEDRRPPASGNPDDGTTPTAIEAKAPAPAPAERNRVRLPDPALRVVVRLQSGRPAPSTNVTVAHQTEVSTESEQPLRFTTDDDGIAVIPAVDLPLGSVTIRARHRELGTASVAITAARKSIDKTPRVVLVLRQRYDVELRFATEDGLPFRGLAAQLSSKVLPPLDMGSDLDPAEPSSGFMPDERGVVTLRDVAPGAHFVRLTLPITATVVHAPLHGSIEVPCPPVNFTIAPVWGSIVVAKGDKILSSPAKLEGCVTRNAGLGHLTKIRERLMKRWKTPAVLVGTARDQRTPRVAWRFLLQEHGWKEDTLQMKPLADLREPHILDLTGHLSGIVHGHLIARWAGKHDQRGLPEFGAWTVHKRTGKVFFATRLKLGETRKLPIGQYIIQATYGPLRRPLGVKRVAVSANVTTEVDLDLPEGVSLCRLTALDPDDSPVRRPWVRVERDDKLVWQTNMEVAHQAFEIWSRVVDGKCDHAASTLMPSLN